MTFKQAEKFQWNPFDLTKASVSLYFAVFAMYYHAHFSLHVRNLLLRRHFRKFCINWLIMRLYHKRAKKASYKTASHERAGAKELVPQKS